MVRYPSALLLDLMLNKSLACHKALSWCHIEIGFWSFDSKPPSLC